MKQLKRPEKNAGGFLPANHYPWQGAFILYRPGYGFVRVEFGNGMNGPDDEDPIDLDENGHKIDDYVYISCYSRPPEEGDFKKSKVFLPGHEGDDSTRWRWRPGLFFVESDGFDMLFSHKSYPSADLRDLLKPALKYIGWPVDVERRYYLIGTDGKFNWNGESTRRQRKAKKC